MLLMVSYQIISGNTVNVHWDLVSCTMLMLSVAGDSVILLLYDARWKASLRDMMSKIKR